MFQLCTENLDLLTPSMLEWIQGTVLPCLGTTVDDVQRHLAYQLMNLLLQRSLQH